MTLFVCISSYPGYSEVKIICRFILPIEGIGLIIWWIVEEIVTNTSTWWLIETDTLATTLMEWAIIILVFIGLNWWMGPLKIYEPKNRYLKFALGLVFKLTPRRRFHSSEDKTVFITPDAVCTSLHTVRNIYQMLVHERKIF